MTKLGLERLKYRNCLVTVLSSSMTSLTPFDSKGKATMQTFPWQVLLSVCGSVGQQDTWLSKIPSGKPALALPAGHGHLQALGKQSCRLKRREGSVE